MTFLCYGMSSKQPEANRALGQYDGFAVDLSHLHGNMESLWWALAGRGAYSVATLSWLEVGKWDVWTERVQV